MTCDHCGSHCQGKYCADCGFMVAREGDAEERITGSYRADGSGKSTAAALEDSITTHTNELLAAVDQTNPKTGERPRIDDAEYHARQLLQCVIGLKEVTA